jgi:hypothetical protein
MAKGVTIKLNYDRVCELGRMYRAALELFKVTDDHRYLLFSHMKDMHHRLKVMAVREQQGNSLLLSDTEAIAFLQTWCDTDMQIPGTNEWSAEITRSICEKIHKQVADLKNQNFRG